MKIKIEYGIKKGKGFVNIVEPETKKLYELSRLVTGTTSEDDEGIFRLVEEDDDNWTTFRYGDEEKEFEIPSYRDEDYPRKFFNVINEIKQWVKSIDYTKTIEFDIEDLKFKNRC